MPSRKSNASSYATVTSANVPTIPLGVVDSATEKVHHESPVSPTDESVWSTMVSELSVGPPTMSSLSCSTSSSPALSGKDSEPNFASALAHDSGVGSSLSAGSSNENLHQDSATVLHTSHFPSLEQSVTVKTGKGQNFDTMSVTTSPNIVHHHRPSPASRCGSVGASSAPKHPGQRTRNPNNANNGSAPRRNYNASRHNHSGHNRGHSRPAHLDSQYIPAPGNVGSFTYTCARCPNGTLIHNSNTGTANITTSNNNNSNDFRVRAQSSGASFGYTPTSTLSTATSFEAVSFFDRGSSPSPSSELSATRRESYNFDTDSLLGVNDLAVIGGREYPIYGTESEVLTYPQVLYLKRLLQQKVCIKSDLLHTAGDECQVTFSLLKLIAAVRTRLEQKQIRLRDVRLNGGAASHVLDQSSTPVYNDIDFIFNLDLKADFVKLSSKEEDEALTRAFDLIRDTFFQVLAEFVFGSCFTGTLQQNIIVQALINKSIKINAPNGVWSLFSLMNCGGPNIEFKFVHQMLRQYEFSMDSFQILLDSFLDFEDVADIDTTPMTDNFYSTVLCESMYGCYRDALSHLTNRLIVTQDPSTIRGGGLLKYCSLLVRDFRTINDHEALNMEPYMINRFLADFLKFGDVGPNIKRYMAIHFDCTTPNNDLEALIIKYNYVTAFIGVMTRSSRIEIDHPSLYTEIQRMALDIYAEIVKCYFRLCASHDFKSITELFNRCQKTLECQCPRMNRGTCIHRLLQPVYKSSQPIVVTYVEDLAGPHIASENERKQNLAEFVKKHDQELCSAGGGWALAFVPTALFHQHHHSKSGHYRSREFEPQSNHYVISASSACTVPYSALVTAAPSPSPNSTEMHFENFLQPPFASCTTYLVTPTVASTPESEEGHPFPSSADSYSERQPSHQVVPLTQYVPIQEHNLPTFISVLSDIEQVNDSLMGQVVTPSFAFRFAPPISPPAGFRLCIVNRFPLYYAKQISSGPVLNSRILDIGADECAFANHYPHLAQPIRSSNGFNPVVLPTLFIPPNYQLITTQQPYRVIYPRPDAGSNVGGAGNGNAFPSDPSNASTSDISLTAASSASSLTESSLYESNKPNTLSKMSANERRSRNNSSPAGTKITA